jgi:hypothetical protein
MRIFTLITLYNFSFRESFQLNCLHKSERISFWAQIYPTVYIWRSRLLINHWVESTLIGNVVKVIVLPATLGVYENDIAVPINALLLCIAEVVHDSWLGHRHWLRRRRERLLI